MLEWSRLPYGEDLSQRDTIPMAMADRLAAVARRTALGGEDGGRILQHGRDAIRAGQIVGVLAAEGCALEILPKIDLIGFGAGHADRPAALRRELIHMLAVALDLDIAIGSITALGTQHETLLEVLIRLFCTKLFEAVRRGLPRRYISQADDLRALRGRLDVVRQFSALAASPQRLACRYDELSPDNALNQILKAVVSRLASVARASDNVRSLRELAFAFADITDIPVSALCWDDAVIDRTNARWGELKRLARLLLGNQFQTTSRGHAPGFALLFEMNVLFEEYVGRLLARALAKEGFAVRLQGGGRYCLIELDEIGTSGSKRFLTRPDIIVSQRDAPKLIIDTKWKRLASQIDDPKRGVAQGDVYQLMAYGRLYGCQQLMLLYPHHAGLIQPEGVIGRHRIEGGDDRLTIATIQLGQRSTIANRLSTLAAMRSVETSPG
ncbi:hypothetical protein MMMDOFMJ_4562 [Methylobacterium gnaphalii]|nr:hypothetical protein MMMDOFMJ_4562 [Methylobacterium gnaphalii]